MPAPVCESCQRAPAYRAATLGAATFLICQGCDLRALEAERRPVRPHRPGAQHPGHNYDHPDHPTTCAARRRVLAQGR